MHIRTTPFARFPPYSAARRVRPIVAALFVIFALCLASPLRAQNSFAFTTPTNVSNDTTGFGPQVLVDSSGNLYIGFLDKGPGIGASSVWLARGSFSGGAFQPSSAPVQVAADGSSFSMALESSCVIDIAYVAPSAPLQPNDVFFAQSSDCGASFKSTNVTHGMAGFPFSFLPHVVVNRGVASIVWVAAPSQGRMSATIFATQRDSAGNFSSPANLATSSTGLSCLTAFAVPGNGNIGVGWCDGAPSSNDSGGNVWALTSLSGTPTKLGPGRQAQFATDASGDIFAAWSLITSGSLQVEFSSAVQSGTFSVKELFLGQNLALSEMMVGAKGNIDLLVVHEQGVPAGPGMDSSTDTITFLVSRSSDGGSSFPSPVAVTTRSCPLCGSGLLAEIAEDSSGLVDVAWEPAGSDRAWGPFSFSQSNAQLSAFSAPVTVPGALDFGTAAITIDPDNHVLLSWSNHGAFIAEGTADATSGGFNVSGSVAPSSATISVGSSATFAVSLHSAGGFSGAVTLACGGAPSGINCSFAPAQVSLTANGSASSTLTVSVVSKPSIALATPPAVNPEGLLSRNLPLLTIGVVLAAVLFIVILSPPSAAHFAAGLPHRRTKNLSSREWTAEKFSLVCRRLLSMTRGLSFSPAGLAAFVLVVVLAVGLISCGGTTTKSISVSGGGTTGTTGTGGTGGMGGTGGTGGGGGTGGSGSVTTQFTVQAQSGSSRANLGTVSITVP